MLYALLKSFHLLFVIGWLVGLFYIPRLFVNCAETTNDAVKQHLGLMAKRLLRFSTILAVLALFTGSWLLVVFHPDLPAWLLMKLCVVVGIAVFHWWCNKEYKNISLGRTKSGVFYRWLNELPLVLVLAVLLLVTLRPM